MICDAEKDHPRPYRILIEANKLFMPGNDGVKRYLTELLESLAAQKTDSKMGD